MNTTVLGCLAAAAAVTFAGAGSAADLESAFGGKLAGPVSASDHDRFISVAEGPDGKIYAAGFVAAGKDNMIAVSRFNADGSLDASFGDGGTAAINVAVNGGSAEVGRGLVVEADGAVLVAGPFEANPGAPGNVGKDLDVAVLRLGPDGKLDAGFGEGGIARIDLGEGKLVGETFITDNAWGLTARDGGYAVFAVTPNHEPGRSDVDFAIVGLSAGGALDPDFGTEGVTLADVNGSGDSARNIQRLADGKLVAAGYSSAGGVVSPVLIRLAADGALDDGFGNGGVANNVVLSGVTEAYNVVPQGENYILAGYGRGTDDKTLDMVVYRFLADGSLDASFGEAGVTRVDLAGEDDRARNVTVLPDGRILAVGSGKLDAENVDALAVLLDADGGPVTSFGENGRILVDLGGPADAFFGLALSADQKSALLAGYKGAAPDTADKDDGVLVRLGL